MIEPLPKKDRKFRHILFERLPGLAFAFILLFLIFGGLFFPTITAYVVIVLNVYFLYKSGMLTLTFLIAMLRLNQGESIDWEERLNSLTDKISATKKLKKDRELIQELEYHDDFYKNEHLSNKVSFDISNLPRFLRKIVFSREKQKTLNFIDGELKRIEKTQANMNWHELQHITIIPHVKEPEHILRETLDHLVAQDFPKEQINVVLAAEERDPEGFPLSQKLAAEYGEIFNNVWVSNHILDTEIETVGKSSNMKAGGLMAFEKVKELGWDLKKTLVTSCDADSKLPEEYFAYVSYEYVTRTEPEYKYYTAAMIFYNNIWRLPFYARVKNSMSTLYNAARLVRTDKLVPFSTYTTSFWMIKEIGFWTPWVTPEDFHLFFKGLLKFGHKVAAVPIYLRIMSDAAEGQTHMDTIRNNYKQERRWAWGISDDGWILMNLIRNWNKHDFITHYRGLHAVFDHVISPVMGVLLIIGGNIPPLLNPDFGTTVLGASLPQVSSSIITLSLGFMILLVLLDVLFKPKRPGRFTITKVIVQLLEWIAMPIASLVLAVLPGLEANTRLLFGKHLEYYVTKKH